MKIKTVLWGLATAALLVSCSGAKLSVANEQYARGEFYDAAGWPNADRVSAVISYFCGALHCAPVRVEV